MSTKSKFTQLALGTGLLLLHYVGSPAIALANSTATVVKQHETSSKNTKVPTLRIAGPTRDRTCI